MERGSRLPDRIRVLLMLTMLFPEAPAPEFVLPDHAGTPVRLSEWRGLWVVLWWYAKAATEGCTLEGEGFRARTPEFQKQRVMLLGVSYDTPEENRAWREAMGFDFRLLSDTDRKASTAFGVVRAEHERFADYPRRATFVIDPVGIIRLTYVVAGCQIETHADRVLEDVQRARESDST